MRIAPRTVVSLLACGLLLTACAVRRQHEPGTPAMPAVSFGSPLLMQRLYYQDLYAGKPFRDALILYYRNGLYKIISQGEEHYGSYVVEGSFDAPSYTVHFISFPSPDWNNSNAYHVLRFDAAGHSFLQQAIVPVDGKLEPQRGEYRQAANTVVDPRGIDWTRANTLMPAWRP